MKITLDLSAYEIELLKDALISRREELRLIALEDAEKNNGLMFQRHMRDKTYCAILHDYIVDLTSIKE